MMNVKPVILAGGIGTRLWPLSRQLYPKQFIKIFDGLSLLQKTLLRNQLFGEPSIIVNEAHHSIATEQLQEISTKADFITEPSHKNTASCAIIAALAAKQDGCDTLILLPSDHSISDLENYISVIKHALKYVDIYGLCVIGIKPESPNIEYGYIKTKNQIDTRTFIAGKFVEKPNLEIALAYFAMASLGYGNYFWNSGIFVFKTDFLLEQAREHQSIMFEQVYNAFVTSTKHKNSINLNKDYYNIIKPTSIDYGIIEHIDHMIMVQGNFLWRDVGSWYPLWRSRAKDKDNNYFEGDVFTNSVKNSYISTSKKLTAVIGLDNIIVINTDDVVLVADKSKSNEIKELVLHLDSLGRNEVVGHANQFKKVKTSISDNSKKIENRSRKQKIREKV